ncbi:MAG: hypothetical protein AAF581_16530 [Planctomycetota bacterium]
MPIHAAYRLLERTGAKAVNKRWLLALVAALTAGALTVTAAWLAGHTRFSEFCANPDNSALNVVYIAYYSNYWSELIETADYRNADVKVYWRGNQPADEDTPNHFRELEPPDEGYVEVTHFNGPLEAHDAEIVFNLHSLSGDLLAQVQVEGTPISSAPWLVEPFLSKQEVVELVLRAKLMAQKQAACGRLVLPHCWEFVE